MCIELVSISMPALPSPCGNNVVFPWVRVWAAALATTGAIPHFQCGIALNGCSRFRMSAFRCGGTRLPEHPPQYEPTCGGRGRQARPISCPPDPVHGPERAALNHDTACRRCRRNRKAPAVQAGAFRLVRGRRVEAAGVRCVTCPGRLCARRRWPAGDRPDLP